MPLRRPPSSTAVEGAAWTPRDVDAWARAEGLSLSRLRQAIPRALEEPSPGRAWWALARASALVVAGESGLFRLSVLSPPTPTPAWTAADAVALSCRILLLFVLWAMTTLGLVGLFVLGHDCGHQSFSRRRWVNSLVGHCCMAPVFTAFHTWRVAHNHHHARTQVRGDDPDWAEKQKTVAEYARASALDRIEQRLAFASPAGLAVGFIVGAVRRTFMASLYPQVPLGARTRRQLLGSNAFMASVSGGIMLALYRWGGPLALLKHHLVPVYFGMVIGGLLTYLHHSAPGALVADRAAFDPMRAQLASTFDVRFPAWFESAVFHINRHLPHHLAPRIPWYHLPSATEALRAEWPMCHQERHFTLAYLLASWRSPLLAPAAGLDGVYESCAPFPRGSLSEGEAARG